MDYRQAAIYSSVRADMDRQSRIDRQMCKPGYTYNETVKKCVANIPISYNLKKFKGGKGGNKGNSGGNGGNSANEAIQMEVAMRQSQGLPPQE